MDDHRLSGEAKKEMLRDLSEILSELARVERERSVIALTISKNLAETSTTMVEDLDHLTNEMIRRYMDMLEQAMSIMTETISHHERIFPLVDSVTLSLANIRKLTDDYMENDLQ